MYMPYHLSAERYFPRNLDVAKFDSYDEDSGEG